MLQVQAPHRLLGKQVPGSPQPASLTPRPTAGRGRAEFKGAGVEGGSTKPQSPCAQSRLQEGPRAEQSLNLCRGLTPPPAASLWADPPTAASPWGGLGRQSVRWE